VLSKRNVADIVDYKNFSQRIAAEGYNIFLVQLLYTVNWIYYFQLSHTVPY